MQSNMMESGDGALGERIGRRLRELRIMRGRTLEVLAEQSGVSRSMISLIERAESSPTAVVLDKLTRSLGVTLSSLFELPEPRGPKPKPPSPLAKRISQPVWEDPESGYTRRNVSPSGMRQPMRIVDIGFPSGARVTFDNARDDVVQQVWMLDGSIDVSIGEVKHSLHVGDCLAMRLDAPTTFHNPYPTAARYAVVISEPGALGS